MLVCLFYVLSNLTIILCAVKPNHYRNIAQASESLKAGRWDRSKYTGTELAGKTLGVVGVGRIGQLVAKYSQGFDMNVIAYDPIMSGEAMAKLGIKACSLEKLLESADFITIHSPLSKETNNLFNADTLQKCKNGVRIINCARGGIVNEKDLLEALNNGRVGGAALDT
jgi:D-3-phosphoglycerate dehydrogenase